MGESELGAYVTIDDDGCRDAPLVWETINRLVMKRVDFSDMSSERELLRRPANTAGLEIINEEDLKENENGN